MDSRQHRGAREQGRQNQSESEQAGRETGCKKVNVYVCVCVGVESEIERGEIRGGKKDI